MATKTKAPSTLKGKQEMVKASLEMYETDIVKALPQGIRADRFIQTCLIAINRTPILMDCTQQSLIGSVLSAAYLGLMPDGFIGEGHFKTRKMGDLLECQFMPGYRGFATLARRTGKVTNIQYMPVYEGDFFEWEKGTQPYLRHKRKGEENPDKITNFYAVIQYTNGGYDFEVLTRAKVEEIRDNIPEYQEAQNKATTVWGQYFPEMGSKTALRRLMKIVSLSPEINLAVGLDELAEMGKSQKNNLRVLETDTTTEEMKDAVRSDIVKDMDEQAAEKAEEVATIIANNSDAALKATIDSLLKKQ